MSEKNNEENVQVDSGAEKSAEPTALKASTPFVAPAAADPLVPLIDNVTRTVLRKVMPEVGKSSPLSAVVVSPTQVKEVVRKHVELVLRGIIEKNGRVFKPSGALKPVWDYLSPLCVSSVKDFDGQNSVLKPSDLGFRGGSDFSPYLDEDSLFEAGTIAGMELTVRESTWCHGNSAVHSASWDESSNADVGYIYYVGDVSNDILLLARDLRLKRDIVPSHLGGRRKVIPVKGLLS